MLRSSFLTDVLGASFATPNVQFTLLAIGFEAHLKQTEGHVGRLEKIMKSLDESPKGKKCKGMEVLSRRERNSLRKILAMKN
jgi:ferritin-like metal-binding protein YciE